MTEEEMIRWHHQLNRHEFEQTPGDGEGQGRLACCSPWGHKEADTTEQLNNNPHHGPITLSTKVRLVKAMVFPVVMYGYKSWTINKAEC